MKFREWLMKEGKAMDVSQDMSNFAKEVLKILKEKKWEFNQTIHQRIVESKYGKKKVNVKTSPKIKDVLGDADSKTGVIRIYLPSKKNPNYIPPSFEANDDELPVIKSIGTTGIPSVIPDYDADFDEYYYTIIHELVHMFDVKVSSQPSWMKKYKDQLNQNLEDYLIAPHEQDAWMAHRAREVIDYYLSKYKGDKNEVKKIISSLSHDTEPESIWYQHPKIWKKYLNTLYQILQSQ